jgi:hypothetical protein|tara:strand:+ start:1384 stop:1716 length:333 start_codon:yes stop_codon:yes gene_type:complete
MRWSFFCSLCQIFAQRAKYLHTRWHASCISKNCANLSEMVFHFRFVIKYLIAQGVRKMTNAEFAKNDSALKAACEAVGIPATSRQASKWRMGFGLAFTRGRKIVKGAASE